MFNVDDSVPCRCGSYRLACTVVFRKQFDRARTTFDAGRERRLMLASDHDRIAGRKLVPIDVPTTRHAMNVVIVRVFAAGFGRGKRLSFSFRESLLSFHRSLQPVARRSGFDR